MGFPGKPPRSSEAPKRDKRRENAAVTRNWFHGIDTELRQNPGGTNAGVTWEWRG